MIASACLPLRNSALPDSRSLVIWAERLGFTGMGGGGAGVSRDLNCWWRALRDFSSSVRARDAVVFEDMSLLVGSMWRGSIVNVSLSILIVLFVCCFLNGYFEIVSLWLWFLVVFLMNIVPCIARTDCCDTGRE